MTHDEIARELNERDKAKKPKSEQYFYGVNYYCPVCDEHLEFGLHKEKSEIHYCINCGQKLDWSFLDKGG